MLQKLVFRWSLFLILAYSFSSCFYFKPNSPAYRKFYAHLDQSLNNFQIQPKGSQYLIIFVNARHLDYTDNYSFLRSIAIHPSDESTNRDFGHAWVYFQGMINEEMVVFHGGHSGERGIAQAKYFDGIMNYIDFGYANPSKEQLKIPRHETNPIKYLWETQADGYFEPGSGNHRPTFAAKVYLSSEQLKNILDFVQNYNYTEYALVGNQCSSFVAAIASLAGLPIESEVTMILNDTLYFNGEAIRLWENSHYSKLTFSSPDILERSLMKAVSEGKAEKAG